MGQIAVSIEIDAPPAVVWHTVEPIESHVAWMHDAVAIHFDSAQTSGVGTRFRCDTKFGPISLADEMEITEWEPPARMGVRHRGVVTGDGVFVLTPIDEDRRTRFQWTETLRFPWWLGGRLGEAIGGRVVIRRVWRRNLESLRELIERPPH